MFVNQLILLPPTTFSIELKLLLAYAWIAIASTSFLNPISVKGAVAAKYSGLLNFPNWDESMFILNLVLILTLLPDVLLSTLNT